MKAQKQPTVTKATPPGAPQTNGKPAGKGPQKAELTPERLAIRRVVCAAIRRKSDGLVICGPRHHDAVMWALIQQLGGRLEWLGAEQGFVDQFGWFLTRKEAKIIAAGKNQILRRCGGDTINLFSESLY